MYTYTHTQKNTFHSDTYFVVYMYVCVCVCVCAFARMYTHMNMCTYMNIHIYINMRTYQSFQLRFRRPLHLNQ